MKSHHRRSVVIAGSCLLLLFNMPVTAETSAHDAHQHNHDEHAVSTLSLDQGKKWQTDAPLRKGMLSINQAAMGATNAFHDDALTQPEAQKLATHINQQVEYLVENCKLEPQADAVLHVLIGDLMSGAGELSKQASSSQGLPRIVGVLQQYPKYFDHPGWGQVTHE